MRRKVGCHTGGLWKTVGGQSPRPLLLLAKERRNVPSRIVLFWVWISCVFWSEIHRSRRGEASRSWGIKTNFCESLLL